MIARMKSLRSMQVLLALALPLVPQALLRAQDDAAASDRLVVVVRPNDWANALDDWRTDRERRGYTVAEIDSQQSRTAIQATIKTVCEASSATQKFVLLAGDIEGEPGKGIPTFYHNSTAMVQFRGDKTIATDNDYADFDGDDTPDAAIGRVSASTSDELHQYLRRVLDYEQSRDFSAWRRNVHVVAGVGGFGVMADAVIEGTTKKFLSDRIPLWSRVTMTQASLGSAYCPNPREFSTATMSRFNEGGTFWVYIGHGHVKTLDYMRVGPEGFPIMTTDDLPRLAQQRQVPIAVFLACYTGACDAIEDSLAERMVLSPHGPIAAIAASRVSGPYGLAMLSDGMLNGYYIDRLPTLGEVLQQAKRKMLVDDATLASRQDQNLNMIGAIAQALSPKGYSLLEERREHAWQVQLLGDPTLHLAHPKPLELNVADSVTAGQKLSVSFTAADAGDYDIELVYRRAANRRDLRDFKVDSESADGLAAYQARYESANSRTISILSGTAQAGQDVFELEIPAGLRRGTYVVRASLKSQDEWFVAAKTIRVTAPPESSGPASPEAASSP